MYLEQYDLDESSAAGLCYHEGDGNMERYTYYALKLYVNQAKKLSMKDWFIYMHGLLYKKLSLDIEPAKQNLSLGYIKMFFYSMCNVWKKCAELSTEV